MTLCTAFTSAPCDPAPVTPRAASSSLVARSVYSFTRPATALWWVSSAEAVAATISAAFPAADDVAPSALVIRCARRSNAAAFLPSQWLVAVAARLVIVLVALHGLGGRVQRGVHLV